MLALAVVLVGFSLMANSAASASPGAGSETNYYVDATRGNDDSSGRSPASAWRGLDRVNATTFAPGDRILFRAGQSWRGQLWPKGSGSAGRPVVIDRYGRGPKPAVHGAGEVPDAVRLYNQHHWEIRNLEVTNEAPPTGTPGTNLSDLRGIHVSGDAGGQLSHFRIDSVDVHDVTGEVNWIGGDPANNAPGITFRTGWDRSKNTGGIVFRGTVADQADPGEPTVLDDIVVEHSTVKRTSFGGIIVKQYTGSNPDAVHTGWGERASRDDPGFAPHTNVVIRDNFITQDGTAYGCNGIYLTDVRGGLVERNVVYRTGTSGIEAYYADNVVVQRNEVYETQQKAGGADSNGIDPDNATTNIDVQYNFVHDNGDGILLCQCGRNFGDTRIRYNVIKSNTRYQIYLHSLRGTTAYIYHNTIYNDRSEHLIFGFGQFLEAEYHIWNNVLYSTREQASLTSSPTVDYESNLYGGAALAVPANDTQSRLGDPLFRGEVTGPYGNEHTGPRLEAALPLRVASGAPAVGTGIPIADNGGADYAGHPVYNGLPDIGAVEYRTPPSQSWESVNGFVADQFGSPVRDATVVLTIHGRRYQTSSQADGFYRLDRLPFSRGGAITARRNGHDPASGTVDIGRGDTTRHDLTMRLQDTDGAIHGRVLDQRAEPIGGATVSVRAGDTTVATTRSGADGGFDVPDVPMGQSYTVIATLDGKRTAQRDGVVVPPGATADAGALLLADPSPEYLQAHDFDNLPTGPLPDGNGGWTVTATGNAVDVVDAASGRVVRLHRTANTGGTAGTAISQIFPTPLRGLVTIETRVMREDPYVSGNHWFSLPYLYNTDGVPAVSIAFDKGNIVAYEGTTARNIGQYALGQWYAVQLVVDTVNQRFDLLLDGDLVVANAAFRNPMPGIASLTFSANSTNFGSAHVDDVRVAQGRP